MRRFVLPVLLALVAGVALAALVVALRAPEASKEQTSPDLKQLEAKVSAQASDLTALTARVDAQSRVIKTQGARLDKICDKDVVGRFDANLTGQQSAYNGTDWTYWDNLTGMLGTVCGALYEDQGAGDN